MNVSNLRKIKSIFETIIRITIKCSFPVGLRTSHDIHLARFQYNWIDSLQIYLRRIYVGYLIESSDISANRWINAKEKNAN